MKRLSIIIPFYINKKAYRLPFVHYNNLGRILNDIEIIMIDDGSETLVNYNDYKFIKFIRLENDIAWNQPAAINEGARNANANFYFIANIDHLILKANIDHFLNQSGPEIGEVFKYPRIYQCKEIKPNKNIFIINKSDFGDGYDEDFCGHYGDDDSYFFASRKLKEKIINIPIVVLEHGNHDLNRNGNHNRKLYTEKLKKLNADSPK